MKAQKEPLAPRQIGDGALERALEFWAVPSVDVQKVGRMARRRFLGRGRLCSCIGNVSARPLLAVQAQRDPP